MKTNIYIRLMLFLLSLVTAFHIGIILKLIPYDIAWGGRLKSDQEMFVFETISILTNLLLISVLFIKAGYLKVKVNKKVINAVLWIFFFLFILNTVGNILAKTTFEKMFAVLTLISAVFLWKILRKKDDEPQENRP
ncbi:MAG: hypothetical protein IPH20_04510 [Bacteroidales bacterium]|nr:hypothetical protein [Bacteroidales bacterium]